MSNINDNTFSKEELLYVYRKVKRDLFFEKDHILIDKIAHFEENLNQNIQEILRVLNGSNNVRKEFILKKENIGEATFLFKEIVLIDSIGNKTFNKWSYKNFQKHFFKIKEIEFRYIADLSIFFHIVGGLWINRIGYKIDATFSDNVYGCRLEPQKENLTEPYYKQNHTLFKPYFKNYKDWQNNLFKKLEQLENKDIVVATSDLRKFYHSVDLNLLKEKISVLLLPHSMSSSDQIIHDFLFDLIRAFNRNNNSQYSFFNKKDKVNTGIPLPFNASRVLANIYLMGLDQDIEENIKPLYYGRYVDDFIIALEYKKDVSTLKLSKILQTLKQHSITEHGQIINSDGQEIGSFNETKERCHLFNAKSDQNEINHLKQTINENSSEWKLLPDTSEYDDISSEDVFYEVNKECERLDSLRKSTGLTLKRNKFLKEIVDFEKNINLYPKTVWVKRLNNFLSLIKEYIFDFNNFIDLSKYVPRLFGIVIHANSQELKQEYFKSIESLLTIMNDNLKKNKKQFTLAKELLEKKIIETICTSSNLNAKGFGQLKFIIKQFAPSLSKRIPSNSESRILKYFNTDLHRIPFKDCYFKYNEYVKYLNSNLSNEKSDEIKYWFFKENELSFITENLHSTECGCESGNCEVECQKIIDSTGFYFYTRKISLLELSVAFKNKVISNNLSERTTFLDLAKLYYLEFKINDLELDVDSSHYIGLDFDIKNTNEPLDNPIIAVTHFETKASTFDAIVRGISDSDLSRFDRINQLINDILRCNQRIDYLIFHELCLPRQLYMEIATRLRSKGVNLVAGLEYKIDNLRKEADNQLLYVLKVLQGSQGESVAIFQSKLIGAVHEASYLFSKSSLKISPKFAKKLVIKHRGVVFSGLICNDMLYIENRAPLVGKVDNLFIIAWNQDIETYEHLIKSASTDIHCFVTAVNNREYGDTRIRAPYKDSWKRDLLKIHGGNLDCFMITELDIKALRNFQMNDLPPDYPFKPFTLGFKIPNVRKLK